MDTPSKTVRGCNVAISPLKTPPPSSQALLESNDQISAVRATQDKVPSPRDGLTPLSLRFVDSPSYFDISISSDVESPTACAAYDLEDRLLRKTKAAKTAGRLRPPTPNRRKAPASPVAQAIARHVKVKTNKAKGKAATVASNAARADKATAVEDSLPPLELDAGFYSVASDVADADATATVSTADSPSKAPATEIVDSPASDASPDFGSSDCIDVQPRHLSIIVSIPVSENMYDILGEEGLLIDSLMATPVRSAAEDIKVTTDDIKSADEASSAAISLEAISDYGDYSSSDSEVELDSYNLEGLEYENKRAFSMEKLQQMPPRQIRGRAARKIAAKRAKAANHQANDKALTVAVNAGRSRKMALLESSMPEIQDVFEALSSLPSPAAISNAVRKSGPTAVSRAVALDAAAAAAAAGIRKFLAPKYAVFNRCQHVSPSLPCNLPIAEGWNIYDILKENEDAPPASALAFDYYGGRETDSASDFEYEFDHYEVLGISSEDRMDFFVAKAQHLPAELSSKAVAKQNKAAAYKVQDKEVSAAVESGRSKKIAAVEASLPPVGLLSSPAPGAATATPVVTRKKEVSATEIGFIKRIAPLAFDEANCTQVQPALPRIAAIPISVNMFAALERVSETPFVSEQGSSEGLFTRVFRFIGGILGRGLAAAKALVGAVKQVCGSKK